MNLFDRDLLELGRKADEIRRSKWQDKVYYVKNLHINYTNICVSKCRFCAFAKDDGDEGSYLMDVDDVVNYVAAKGLEAKELHVVGGLHPAKPFSFYIDMIGALKTNFPDKTIKGFTAVEIDYFSRIADISPDSVLKQLKKAGLEMMPGGGAEIFNAEIRNQICPEKIPSERWLEIMRIAHLNGIKTNATMLYGHIERDSDKMEHLEMIRNLQEETGGFLAFIPLSFHIENTSITDRYPSTGVEDLKTVAVSRIVLDNVDHIKAYWVMLGEKTAQTALRFGADDLDGTIVKENITHAAGASSKEGLTESELKWMIKACGLRAVERDAFYNEI